MRHIILTTLLFSALQMLFSGMASAFCFEDAGSSYSLSPRLLESIAAIESGMNPAARNQNRNGSTDFGLMQVNSYWIKAAGLDRERLVMDACYNTQAGARVLRGCIDRYGYTWEAVGCYNATSVDKRKNYAWKVYRQLVTAEKRKQRTTRTLPAAEARLPYGEQKTGSMTVSFEDPDPVGQLSLYPWTSND